MSRKFLLIVIYLIVGKNEVKPDGCGMSRSNKHRIVGGRTAANGAWPWMVLIGYRNDTHFGLSCGGTLITLQHILTASHCFDKPKNFVRLGEYDLKTETDGKHFDVSIDRVVKHEQYDPVLLINDIALVRMAQAVDFTDLRYRGIWPICLPVNEYTQSVDLVGRNLFVAGWGYLEENTTMSTILQEAQIPVIHNKECKKKFQKLESVRQDAHIRFDPRYVLCAGLMEGGTGTCQGDSGGPLMLPVQQAEGFAYYQMGIVSYGKDCARADFPGVYTNVRFYMNWIYEKLEILR